MAQQIRNVLLGSPGFKGVNTEDSPISLDPTFAQVANNAIIDRFGRLGARKGFTTLTDSASALSSEPVVAIHQWQDYSGNDEIFVAGNRKIFRADTTTTDKDTLTEITDTGGTHTFSGDEFHMENFNGVLYIFQKGDDPVLIDATLNGSDEYETVQSKSDDASTIPQAGFGIGAYGRLWYCDIEGEESTIYWSDLFIGHRLNTGSAGSIDVTRVWPNGYDQVIAIAAHNDALIIFGRDNIVIYAGATSPSTMVLSDAISGVGCVDPGSIQATGGDLVFLSPTGLRSLGRTIQESSRPLNDISSNVRSDFLGLAEAETDRISSVYSREEAFYLINFPSQETTYCYDMRGVLQDGARRVTVWPGSPITCGYRATDGTLYLGNDKGLGKYDGYTDDGVAYQYKYVSPVLTFGDTSRLKILKKIRPTVIGGSNVIARVEWGYGFSGLRSGTTVRLNSSNVAQFGVSQFGIATYSGGVDITDEAVNATGSGTDITIGYSLAIDGEEFSLQEINVLTLLGQAR